MDENSTDQDSGFEEARLFYCAVGAMAEITTVFFKGCIDGGASRSEALELTKVLLDIIRKKDSDQSSL